MHIPIVELDESLKQKEKFLKKQIVRNQVFVFIITFWGYAVFHMTRTGWSFLKPKTEDYGLDA